MKQRTTIYLITTAGIIYVIFILLEALSAHKRHVFYSYDNTNLFYFTAENDEYYIDNHLILRQPNISLPPNNGNIFGRIKFGIFPSKKIEEVGNRIYSQMRYLPPHYFNKKEKKHKLILLYNGDRGIKDEDFKICPVKHCKITGNRNIAYKSDVIIWVTSVSIPTHTRPPGQVWGFFFHESPMHSSSFTDFLKRPDSLINWTLSYRPDSTIAVPYFFYSPYDLINKPPEKYPLGKTSYAKDKSQMVAWFASNCNPSNDRSEIIEELKRYVQVDSYGKCGNLHCSRENAECFELLNKKYKFYLAFENSNCRYYITEKFFYNALSNNILPIVMGAHPDDYKIAAPPYSYIHIDQFETLKGLANYLKYLDGNDTAYDEYFSWKDYGTINFDQSFVCRLCMMAHEADQTKSIYTNLNLWWHGKNNNICFKSGKWKDHLRK